MEDRNVFFVCEGKENKLWHRISHRFCVCIFRISVKTVASLLGHSRLEHTEKWLYLIYP